MRKNRKNSILPGKAEGQVITTTSLRRDQTRFRWVPQARFCPTAFLRKQDAGQILIFTALFMMTLVLFFLFIFNVGRMVTERIKMQNAVDAAAHTAALWQARGLNLESHLNLTQDVLYWATLGALVSLQWPLAKTLYNVSCKVTTAQDKIADHFPNIALGSAYLVARKNGADRTEVLNFKMARTLGIKKTSKIPLLDKVLKKVPLDKIPVDIHPLLQKGAFTIYELDTPKYWSPQEKTGPYITLIACKKNPEVFGAKLLNLKKLPISTVATARPKYKKGKLTSGRVKAGWGASLMPVRLPGDARGRFRGRPIYH